MPAPGRPGSIPRIVAKRPTIADTRLNKVADAGGL